MTGQRDPNDEPEIVDVHNFPQGCSRQGDPVRLYDVATNGVGVDHDTPVFAVTTIEAWWKPIGSQRYSISGVRS